MPRLEMRPPNRNFFRDELLKLKSPPLTRCTTQNDLIFVTVLLVEYINAERVIFFEPILSRVFLAISLFYCLYHSLIQLPSFLFYKVIEQHRDDRHSFSISCARRSSQDKRQQIAELRICLNSLALMRDHPRATELLRTFLASSFFAPCSSISL